MFLPAIKSLIPDTLNYFQLFKSKIIFHYTMPWNLLFLLCQMPFHCLIHLASTYSFPRPKSKHFSIKFLLPEPFSTTSLEPLILHILVILICGATIMKCSFYLHNVLSHSIALIFSIQEVASCLIIFESSALSI